MAYSDGPVQTVVGSNYGSGAGPFTAAYGSNVTNGNLLVAFIGLYGVLRTVTLTDGRNTWFQAGSYQVASSDTNTREAIFYTIAGASEALTVSAALDSGTAFCSIAVAEFNGNLADVNTILDTAASANGSSTAPDSGSVAIGTANSLLVACAGTVEGSGVFTAGSGSTIRYRFNTNEPLITEDGVYSVATHGLFSIDGNKHWVCNAASFKPVASGGTTLYRMTLLGAG